MKKTLFLGILAMLISFAANKAAAQQTIVTYFDEYGDEQTHEANKIDVNVNELSSGWYYVESFTLWANLNIPEVTISGNVYLILGTSSKLTISKLTITEGSSFTIYSYTNSELVFNTIAGGGTFIVNSVKVTGTSDVSTISGVSIIINDGELNVSEISVNELTINSGVIVSAKTSADKITLSWNSESDKYELGTLSANTLEIADGKVFVIDGKEYSGTIDATDIAEFTNKTLTPPTYPVPNITLTPIAGIKYDGEPHQLLTVAYPDGEITDGQLVFSVDGDDTEWSSLPMATNIGNHSIKYKIISNTPKYVDSESKSYEREVEITAIGSSTVDGIYYVILDDKNVQVGDGKDCAWPGTENPEGGKITIPATVSIGGETYTVSKIGDNAFNCFKYGSVLKEVDFAAGNSIKTIGANAFSNNTSLEKVNLDACKELTTIGGSAFAGSTYLEAITIPSKVKEIGYFAFSTCSSLATVTIAEGSVLETIDDYAFSNTAITKITIPASIKSIGKGAFHNDDPAYRGFTLTCHAIVAPSLGTKAFSDKAYVGESILTVPLCGSGYDEWKQYFEDRTVINVTETSFSESYSKEYDGTAIFTYAEDKRPTRTFSDGVNSFSITSTAVTFFEKDQFVNTRLNQSPSVGKGKLVKVTYDMSQTTGGDECSSTGNVITLSSTNNYIKYVGDVYIPAKGGSKTFYVGVQDEDAVTFSSEPTLPTNVSIAYQYDNEKGEQSYTVTTTNGAEIKDYVLTSPDDSKYSITVNLHVVGEMYAVYDDVKKTFTFKCGDKNSETSPNTYDLLKDDGNPGWYQKAAPKKSTKVVFDPSFDVARPTNCYTWFYAFISLESISGLQYFHTDEVTTMESMFDACESLERLDLSHFNTSSVTTMAKIFNGMSAVKAIYVGDQWQTASTTTDMFKGCKELVGGLGTPYAAAYIDGTRAKIDGGEGDEGYFTDIAKHGYAVYANGTLTFKCGEIPDALQGTVYELPSGGDPAWLANSENITEVVFESGFKDVYVSSCEKWFYGCAKLATITDLTNLNTSNVTNMNNMFSGCNKLASVDLSKFNTANVTDMSGMFEGCALLSSIDLSSFNTKKVENFSSMFSGCTALTQLPTINKITLKENTAVDVQGMFAGSGLTEIDLSHWAGNSVTSFTYLFQNCTSLKTVNLSGVITTNAKSIDYLFDQCSALNSVDLSNSVTDNVTTMRSLFAKCESLTVLDLSSFDTKSVDMMAFMFDGCKKLTTIKVKEKDASGNGWNTDNVPDNYEGRTCIFQGADNLIGDKGTTPKDAAATDPYFKFAHPDGGTSDPGYLSTSGKYKIFYNGIDDDDKTLDTYTGAVTEFLNENVTLKVPTKPGYIFDGWTGTPITGLPSTPTKDVTIAAPAVGNRIYTAHWTAVPAYAVYNNGTLTFKVGESTSETGTVYTIPASGDPGWLENADAITKVVFDPSFDDARPVTCYKWFSNCENLTEITGMKYLHTDNVTDMSNMFYRCQSLQLVDLSQFNTAKVTTMENMFYGCLNLRMLNLTSFNTAQVENMAGMFNMYSSKAWPYTVNITRIYVGTGWTTNSVSSSDGIFYRDINLVGGKGTPFDENAATISRAKIDGGEGDEGYFTDIANYGYAGYKDGKLTFKQGNIAAADLQSTVYELVPVSLSYTEGGVTLTGIKPAWYNQRADITSVEFESNFKNVIVTTCRDWFKGCTSLTEITGMTNLNTTQVTDMSSMFCDCTQLESDDIDLSNFDTRNVYDFSSMFEGCTKLKKLNNITKITLNTTKYPNNAVETDHSQHRIHLTSMFAKSGLEEINVSHWASTPVGSYSYLFYGCDKLKNVNVTGIVKATTTVPVTNAEVVATQDLDYMFYGCSSLGTDSEHPFDVSSFVTGNVRDMSYMFCGCSGLDVLDISNFKMGTVTNISYMFYDCSNLTTIMVDEDEWPVSSATSKNHIFRNSYSLIGNTGTIYDGSMYASKSDDSEHAKVGDGGYLTIDNYKIFYDLDADDDEYIKETVSGAASDYDGSRAVNLPTLAARSEGDDFKHWLRTTQDESGKIVLGTDKITTIPTTEKGNRIYSAKWTYTKEKFVVFDEAGTLTFKYDVKPETGEIYSLNEGATAPGWVTDHSSDIKNVVFAATIKPSSCYHWFEGCTKLIALDLTKLNTSKVTDMTSMFKGCTNLTAILVGDDWSTAKVAASENMFDGCTSLIGDGGDWAIESDYFDKTNAYARDNYNNPGFLTKVNFKIFYDADGGEFDDLESYGQYYIQPYTDAVTELQTPAKDGYTFLGWVRQTSFGTYTSEPTTSVTIDKNSGNYSFKAKWLLGYKLNLPDGWTAYAVSDVERETPLTTANAGEQVVLKYDGSYKTADVKVFPMPKSITITNDAPLTLHEGDEQVQLNYEISPKGVWDEDKKVTWTSSDVNVVEVSADGKVTAKGLGATTITAITVNGKKATIDITVEE